MVVTPPRSKGLSLRSRIGRIGLFLALWLIPPAALAECAEVPRTVLALYDGTREVEPRFTRLHRYLELPLNHLGYRLSYHDIAAGPPEAGTAPVAATVSWLDSAAPDPEAFAAWRADFVDPCGSAPPVVTLGHTGIAPAAAGGPGAARYLARLGLAAGEGEVAVGAFSEVAAIDATLLGHETEFLIEPGPYAVLTAADPAATRLRLEARDVPVDLVVTAPGALYAHDSALARPDPRGGALWVADPFALLGHVLDAGPWPVPDTTTLSGRRIFFATVDAEGWLSRLPARDFGDRPPLAAEVLEQDLLVPFADLPISVAVLAGDLDPAVAGAPAEQGREVAARVLALPHVQPATAGLSMIRDWTFFSAYDPDAEAAALVLGRSRRDGGGLVASAVQNLGSAFGDRNASAFDVTPDAPRKYAHLAFDIEAETAGALAVVAELAETDGVPLYVWGGNAIPFPGAVDAVRRAGAPAMGGGGGLAPDTAPSIANLWPLAADTGAGLQVYDALSGDARYTDFWTGEMAGFQALAQTLERTETPRRLKPFHLAFAARSAVDFATRSAVRRNFEAARAGPVLPITAGRYVATVEGFFGYRAVREADAVWRIEDRGALQTVRFDAAADHAVDLAASEGVAGARREGDRLYVALDPSTAAPRVALVRDAAQSGLRLDRPAPVLVEGRAEILALERQACETRATLSASGPAETVWAAVAGRSYDVALLDAGGERRHWEQLAADADGRLVVSLPLEPRQATGIVLSTPCREEG